MKPERIEELMSLAPDQMVEEATDAELLHLLRCARAWAELEAQIRSQGLGGSARLSAWARLSDAVVELDCGRFGRGPDLLTATEAAIERAKETP